MHYWEVQSHPCGLLYVHTDFDLDYFLFHLSGVLAQVSDVSINNSCDSITISWSAPFSLDVSGLDPDIWYTLLISNVTDEDHPTAVPCTDCHNLTQTHYTFNFTIDTFNFDLTIIAKNGAGDSPGYVVNNSGM